VHNHQPAVVPVVEGVLGNEVGRNVILEGG